MAISAAAISEWRSMAHDPIGAMIYQARQRRGYTQDRLGEIIGKGQHYISQVERGLIQQPDDVVLRDFSAALAIPLEDLLRATGREVVFGESQVLPVRGLVPADAVRYASGEGATVSEVRVLPEKIQGARDPFGLEVRGDCLSSIGILSGDIVIVEPARGAIPANGKLVVVRIGDEISLKRWSLYHGTVELRDGNDHVVYRGKPEEVEVLALYVTFDPRAPR